MLDSQAKSRIRSRAEALHEPRHDDEGPIKPASANEKNIAPQEGLARASSGMPVMTSPLTNINNITLPTPRQRLVHPTLSDSQCVGTISKSFQAEPWSGEDDGYNGLGFGIGS